MIHEHLPQVIFDWLENRHFSTLTSAEQEQVLAYFSEEEYNELHNNAFYIRKSLQAGSTSGHAPVKAGLLKTFDKTYTDTQRPFPFLQVFWKIAAVFLLFATGWLCHYLSGYKHNASETMADTVYITQKNLYTPEKIFDTIYIGTDRESPGTTKIKHGYDKMREKRDATEYIPAHTNTLPSHIQDGRTIIREMQDSNDDSLLKPANS
jgi:hypothetical protein